ncbi:hypothetical protein GUITHDRAFT_162660 [Guillardia theta CCMP2712]|uniref:Uncharacterized protein n=1 Tax=Guillardia theta (strain CCMP2712) TaxID=905079 RepID=L1JGH0_GUITC|nr:hypothetical protein GUITHDRAFT_162660 [Guillardia theta CCMP2712]EKX47618.1 hypothetical protein GUITHDRAFT_162660 [Guillardia theta CCMP2712]|eukprot:XP_005834598.1 hypothetical protein GUITHDRAFT_162660 [Guillardia theta CCMP2712]
MKTHLLLLSGKCTRAVLSIERREPAGVLPEPFPVSMMQASRSDRYEDELRRTELPLELRTFGAPPEYTDAIRSPQGVEHTGGFGLNTLKEGDASFASLAGSRRGQHEALSRHDRDDVGASGEDVDQEQRSNLSEAVIRKLKQKNSQLEKELRDKKRQLEDMMKSVVSWKNSIKDKHISKIEEVETIMKQKLQKSHMTSRKLKVKLLAEIMRKRSAITKSSVLNFWHEIAMVGRCASSELMVAFLKEQLNSTGQTPRSMPKPNNAHEEELMRAQLVLESLLSQLAPCPQIPTGNVSEYDGNMANAEASPAQVRKSLTSQLEMVWAEVRELVAKSANQQGISRASSSSSGISHELVIARLRGKLDHLSKMLEAKDSELEDYKAQLEQKSPSLSEEHNKELALANVKIKELEQLLSKSSADMEEKENQLKQQVARINSLAAALQSKEEDSSLLSSLQNVRVLACTIAGDFDGKILQRIVEMHHMMRELEPDKPFFSLLLLAMPRYFISQVVPKAQDAFTSLKAISNGFEVTSSAKNRVSKQLEDSQRRLETAEANLAEAQQRLLELKDLADRFQEKSEKLEEELQGSREKEKQLSDSLTAAEEAIEREKQEKKTLQAQGQQILRDADRVSNLARERAASLLEKSQEIQELQGIIGKLRGRAEECRLQVQTLQTELAASVEDLRFCTDQVTSSLETEHKQKTDLSLKLLEARKLNDETLRRVEDAAREAEQMREENKKMQAQHGAS